MTYRRRRKSSALATQAVELGLAVPQVLAHRLTRMALAGPSPSNRDRKEFYRMGAEKMAASYESWIAMWLEVCRANLELSLSAFRYPSLLYPMTNRSWRAAAARIQRSALGVVGQGLAPVHRRAVANAKRLGRRR